MLKLRALLLAKSEHLTEAAEEYRMLIKYQKTRKGSGSSANVADTYMQLAAALTALSDDPCAPTVRSIQYAFASRWLEAFRACTSASHDALKSRSRALVQDTKVMQLDEVCKCYEKAATFYAKKNTPENSIKGEDARQRLVEVRFVLVCLNVPCTLPVYNTQFILVSSNDRACCAATEV